MLSMFILFIWAVTDICMVLCIDSIPDYIFLLVQIFFAIMVVIMYGKEK